ncbi:ADYC domain-containing protein [Polyangium aurulentum]|uniref:ADYC domain-containing protein n=1 Tax=Polyangium aurulentum TaxID=2567896 RepID=UPI001EF1AD33|nr:ADYC domain-containing protein [Polyangium aurulentum]
MSCALIVAGCAGLEPSGEGDEGVRATSQAVVFDNGTSLNGTSLNGTSLNGTSLNGTSLNGTSLNGTSLNGTSLNGTSLNGTSLNGLDFIGATIPGTLSDGNSVTLRIDTIVPSSDPEILLYTVSFQDGADRKSICGYDAAGLPVQAIPLAGRWDTSQGTATGGDWIDEPGTMTFGCADSALAKCILLGYKPWKTLSECQNKNQCQTISVRAMHQACTRMVRADYCGDGMPHTMNKVPINLWDAFGIQSESRVIGNWKNEAEWSPNGMVCVDTFRYDPDGKTTAYVDAHCPERNGGHFQCFGNNSSFFTNAGFSTPINERSLVREEFDQQYVRSSLY